MDLECNGRMFARVNKAWGLIPEMTKWNKLNFCMDL